MTTFEIDLHGHTWLEAQEEFIEFYNGTLDRVGNATSVQLGVIHGYGSTGEGGVIRERLRGFLQRFGDRLEFLKGEDFDGNPGLTIVIPLKRLPDRDGLLAEAIWKFCERPRSRSKVIGKFRKHGSPKVMQAVRSLEKEGRLTPRRKGAMKMYEAN